MEIDTIALAAWQSAVQGRSPQEVLRWAVENFSPRVALSCSFGGPGLVLAHMLAGIRPEVPIIFLDTGFLFEETLQVKDEYVRRYGLNVKVVRPTITVGEQNALYGEGLYSRNPDLCCHIRKVEPMVRELEELDAWVTGLRREQSPTRVGLQLLELHTLGSGRVIAKVNPLANWTKEDVWTYIRQNGLPYNPLVDRGYRSIGCRPCTRVVAEGEHERSGRWSGHEKTECGLHTFTKRVRIES